MEIYLVRHTTPDIAKGVCYGQADLDVTDSFEHEAALIKQHLPGNVSAVHSSPLQRCKKLAEHLFAGHTIQLHDDLKEIHCGKWEMRLWDEISKEEVGPWMDDLLNVCIPGGESYTGVFKRVSQCFDKIISRQSSSGEGNLSVKQDALAPVVIVAHGGVIRSILSYITETPLIDSFKVFSLHYGCVVKVVRQQSSIRYEVLSNVPQEKETHKPSRP
ncbi:MAG: alpha-ribazole phosphatase family protein [Ferruginibacter sp.]